MPFEPISVGRSEEQNGRTKEVENVPDFRRRYDYYSSNRAAAAAAVVKSVSLSLGVPPARIGVVSDGAVAGLAGAAGNGTGVCLSVQSYTASQAAVVQVQGCRAKSWWPRRR